MDEVVDLIWSNEGYRERFTALIPADSEELFKAEFKKFFGEDNEAGEALRDTMGELAREFPRLKSIRLLIMRRWMSTMI